MSSKVYFEISKGWLKGQPIKFEQKELVSVGHSDECTITLPEGDEGVSGRHCLLDINPPFVAVKDLGSTNGTYLNGKKIGQRSSSRSDEENRWFNMKPGDRLGLGVDFEIILSKITDAKGKVQKQEYVKNIHVEPIDGYNKIIWQGEGGMGEVWLVEEEKTREQMVMKFMLPDVSSNEQKKEWFLREASIGEQIKHPNIVRQHKSGKTDAAYYILMEYCRGGNLEDFISREDLKIAFKNADGETEYEKIFWGRSDEALKERIKIANHVILQVLEGLDHIHHASVKVSLPDGTRSVHGLVHRDLKPSNILLMDHSVYPEVKLGDFGLAKAFHLAGHSKNVYSAGRYYGYLWFVPRQQIRNYRYVKPDVDVWAAAATYYYMITSFPPKDFAGDKNVYSMALNNAIPIRDRDPRIPACLAKVIDTALKDNPKIGIKSALKLKNEINKIKTSLSL